MLAEIKGAKKVFLPSPFWEILNKQALNEIASTGLDNFKRTVNRKYFNWGIFGLLAHQFFPMLINWLKNPSANFLGSTLEVGEEPHTQAVQTLQNLNFLAGRIYSWYVSLLYEFVKAGDPKHYLDSMEEPLVGNPYLVNHSGKKITQDLCNSVHEFYSSTNNKFEKADIQHIVELGAGYGRLAFVFLKANPICTYTIVDIPIALYISQEYLSNVFPKERIFRFRHFNSYEEIKEEFESCRLRFVCANQIELLPEKRFDLFISISSLHEMTQEQISFYFQEINRLTKGNFYTKQWRKSKAHENGFTLSENEYPVPQEWKTVFHRRHPIQTFFFEALYDIF